MLVHVHTGTLLGIEAHPVFVEANFVRGLPGFDVVGLPEAAVRESKVRVKAALDANNFELPKKRILINLAPGDLRKTGSSFDLAIAVRSARFVCGQCAPDKLEDNIGGGRTFFGRRNTCCSWCSLPNPKRYPAWIENRHHPQRQRSRSIYRNGDQYAGCQPSARSDRFSRRSSGASRSRTSRDIRSSHRRHVAAARATAFTDALSKSRQQETTIC